jgi:hypothetical protein
MTKMTNTFNFCIRTYGGIMEGTQPNSVPYATTVMALTRKLLLVAAFLLLWLVPQAAAQSNADQFWAAEMADASRAMTDPTIPRYG